MTRCIQCNVFVWGSMEKHLRLKCEKTVAARIVPFRSIEELDDDPPVILIPDMTMDPSPAPTLFQGYSAPMSFQTFAGGDSGGAGATSTFDVPDSAPACDPQQPDCSLPDCASTTTDTGCGNGTNSDCCSVDVSCSDSSSNDCGS